PATGEKLTEKSKKFESEKAPELPGVFGTGTAVIFTQDATELPEKRLNTGSITAG
ncbi:hypothetical protein CH063_13971, partial [Colletotrichum higginsianum]